MAPRVAFPPWGGLLPSRPASSGPLPPHWPSFPAWSEPGPPGCLGPLFSASRPRPPVLSVSLGQAPVLCSDLRASLVMVSPRVCLRGLRDERLLDDQTVISEHKSHVGFPARLCWGPRAAPRFWDSSTTATIPPSHVCRVHGPRKKARGTQVRAARSPVPVVSPEMLNSRATSWPRLPGQGGLACCDSWGRKESDTTE